MSKKKYDKTTVAVVAVCIVLLFGWNYIFGPSGLDWLPQPQPKEMTSEVQKATSQETAKTSSSAKVQPTAQKAVAAAPVKASASESQKTTVANVSIGEWANKYPAVELTSPDSLYTVKINPAGGDIDSVTLNKISNTNNTNPVVLAKGITPGALSIAPPQESDTWKLLDVKPPVKTNDSLTVTRDFENGKGQDFSLTQKWTTGKNYATKYDVSIQNNSSDTLNMRNLYFFAGSIPPVDYISGDYVRMESNTVDALLVKSNDLYTIKAGSSDFQKNPIQYDAVKWVSVSDAYFAYILKAAGNTQINAGNYIYSSNESINTKKGDKKSYELIGTAAREQSITLQPNTQQSWSFDYYAGPKDVKLLDAFAAKGGEILHLMSWPVFKTLAEWFLYALIWLNGIVGNFGVAIIVLTIIVKVAFWPITHKSNKSMKRMQKIQPMVKELREQYKDDKQKLNQATMELYKREKVNPLGGCLPILIQIPVFIALYYTLGNAFEIRHASFLWAKDLTQADTVGHIFGIAINPFAIMMAITMLLQQKMTPTATDPAQAKMMMLMPLVMLIFLYTLPSGLTLYWTVSQLITIVQLLYNKYSDKDDAKDFTNNDKNNDKKNYKKNKKLKA
jgi:YidC/Oxa1 family membrane protein insertase